MKTKGTNAEWSEAGQWFSDGIMRRTLAWAGIFGQRTPNRSVPENHARADTLLLAQDYITGEPFRLIRQRESGLVAVHPFPRRQDMGKYYPDQYYGEKPFAYEINDARSRFRSMRRQIKPGDSVLDIGCGRGLLLDRLRSAGCAVAGTELSEHSSRYARETLGLIVERKNIEDAGFPARSFDCVTMFHSLEHMLCPESALKEARRILKPNGKILIEVPRFDSGYARWFGANWFHLDVPRHLYHFEERTLLALLERTGFQTLSVRKYGIVYDAFGCLQSMLNGVCSEFNLLNDITTKRKSAWTLLRSGTWRQRRDALVSLAALTFLFGPLLLVAGAVATCGRGGILRVWATPCPRQEKE